ncbi:MAG: hypothetical protein R3F56_08445 [Planctomycetota bacterium]
MVWALIFVIVTAGMIISHSAYMASHRQTMDVQLKRKPLAANLARAALTDGLSWFQAQATQPVAEFSPQSDPLASPPTLDTEDPTLGLVREFEIRGDLWGRYEIRKNEAMDTSLSNGIATPGSVWELAARGFVYRKQDATVAFDQPPNKLVSMARVETSIRTVPLALPASAAVGVDNVLQVSLGPGGRIVGGGGVAGLAAPVVDPLPIVPPGISGTPGVTLLSVYKSAPSDVFKMPLAALRDVSDMAVANGSLQWLTAKKVKEFAVVFHDGDLAVPPGQPLDGSMLLVVSGNLTVQPGTGSKVNGVVFVTGNTDIRGPFTLNGMLVGRGAVHLQGNGAGQDAVIQHDPVAVQRLLQSLSRYRANRVVRNVDAEIADVPAATPPIIGSGTVVDPTAKIGDSVTLGSGVQVGKNTELKDDVIVGDNTVIGQAVRLDDQVEVGVGVQIGNGVRIDALAIIGDGAVIGPGVTIGAGAKITPGAVVPDGTVVRAGSVF